MTSKQSCSICFNRLFNLPIGALQCGHVFHFTCIHDWLSKSDADAEKNCPSCRKKAKVYDVIRLYGLFENDTGSDDAGYDSKMELNDTEKLETRQKQDNYQELAVLRTENMALKRDMKKLQDASQLETLQLENQELRGDVERLATQLKVKNQELIDCRMTVVEFSLLIPRLEEQQRKSTTELKNAITNYQKLRAEIVKKEDELKQLNH